MAELMEQYEKYKKTGLVLDEKNMPIVGGRKADAERHNPTSLREARAKTVAAAEARARAASLMGAGRLGGGGPAGEGEALGGGSGRSWRDATPAAMASWAADARQRKWDQANGLDRAELEAMADSAQRSGDDDDDDEVEIVDEIVGTSRGRSQDQPTATAPVALVRSNSARDAAAGSNSTSGAAAGSNSTSGLIRWGAHGQGTWVQMPCPVCGPTCSPELHRTNDPPPQDIDEGAASMPTAAPSTATVSAAGAAAKGIGVVAATTATTTNSASTGGSSVVDLTLSSDDDGMAPPPPRSNSSAMAAAAAAAAGDRAAKRPRREASLTQPDGTQKGHLRQPGAEAPVAPMSARQADVPWQCTRCTLVNDSASAMCEMGCGQEAPGSWACLKCSMRNVKVSSGCAACGTWRYSRELLGGTRSQEVGHS